MMSADFSEPWIYVAIFAMAFFTGLYVGGLAKKMISDELPDTTKIKDNGLYK